jgi:alpha-glucosidase (family GH31 glycosyl hydrolase)
MYKTLVSGFIVASLLLFSGCNVKQESDIDQDTVVDPQDNCPKQANPKQKDLDNDGLGDICDDDIDGDGFSNEHETIAETDSRNPKSLPNLFSDRDRDGFVDKDDKCPDTPIGRDVDEYGCEKAKRQQVHDNFGDEIKLNPPHTEPLIPKWALGYMQSGWGDEKEGSQGYDTQSNFIDHAKALRGLENQYGKHLHPADIMVLDMYWTGKEWSWPGNMTWDHGAFPDPKGMIDELHALNFKLMMNYHEGGFGLNWLAQLKRDLDYGLDIVWLDFWRGDSTYEKQVWQLIREHSGNNKRIMFMARHYARPNHHNQEAILGGDFMRSPNEEAMEKSMPVHWTGDVKGTWEGFAESIEGVVYSEDGAMGGWSYLHTDTPGHTQGEDPELATRWIQFSDFTTMTRNHGTTGRDVWSWGPQVEEDSRFSRMLRYRLLPYIYTYSWEIWEKALPLTRPLKLAYPGQRDELRYQYMFGDELLVAPVYNKAASFPDNKMNVYLPKGEEWVDYWTHEVHQGGQTIGVDVGLDNQQYIPLYAKRGAIIPMGPEIYWIDTAVHADPITLDIYPLTQGKSRFTLYDDDGETLEYQKGGFVLTEFKVNRSAKGIEVNIGESQGRYKGKPDSQNYIFKINLIDEAYTKVILNNSTLSQVKEYQQLLERKSKKGWALDVENKILYIRFVTATGTANIVKVKK